VASETSGEEHMEQSLPWSAQPQSLRGEAFAATLTLGGGPAVTSLPHRTLLARVSVLDPRVFANYRVQGLQQGSR
jgi:hypothetical protein